MELLDKKEKLNQLFELYKELLTDKQGLYYEHYFHEDYSLQEIADLYQVSRNAVHDQLKKVEDYLLTYEHKLGLYAKQQARLALIDELEKTKNLKIIEQLRKLDE